MGRRGIGRAPGAVASTEVQRPSLHSPPPVHPLQAGVELERLPLLGKSGRPGLPDTLPTPLYAVPS